MRRIVSEERIRELLDIAGGPDAVLEAGRQFTANREYAEAHHEQLKQQYPDQWVGIVRQQVLVHGDSAEDVVRAVREANEDTRGMVLHHACVEEPIWIL